MNWLSDNAGNQGMKRHFMLMAGVLAGALMLAGCNDNKTSSTEGSTAPAKTATVELSASFPDVEAAKSIIPSYTAGIGFVLCRMTPPEYWCDLMGPTASAVLVTRENPKATIAVPPGYYMFGAAATTTASTDPLVIASTAFDMTEAGGELVEGTNTVKLTFLQGKWTFKTSTGAADPITLGDGSTFSAFTLRANAQMPAAATNEARKVVFDYQQPVGVSSYSATLHTSAGDIAGGGVMFYSQFHSGNDNTNGLIGMDFNLTKGCARDDYMATCNPDTGDWSVFLMNSAIEAGNSQYDNYGPYALLPDNTLTNSNNNPVDLSTRNSNATDGVTIVAQFADFQYGGETKSLVIVGAAAAKSAATDVVRSSRERALGAAINAAVGEAGKSVATTNLGNLTSRWYEPVIASNGVGTNKGTWNFDDYVWNPATQTYDVVTDGCLVTGDPSGRNFAYCGYLDSIYNPTSGLYESDMGDYSWGLAPTDPQNLGEYGNCSSVPGYYDPWCFYDQNGDGIVDMGSFVFSHYLKDEEAINNTRFHKVTAKGVAIPEANL